MNRAPCDQWPRILNPAWGDFPPAAERRADERVLLVTLQDAHEPMAPVRQALERACGPCQAVDWRDGDAAAVQDRITGVAHRLRPTIVFLRLQRAGSPLTPKFVEGLRAHCDRNVVIVHWNGDQYEMAGTPAAAWMVELGRAVDTTLLVNTQEQSQLAQAGVRHPGFLAAGYDQECYQPRPQVPWSGEVVCLANAHKPMPGYERRNELLRRFVASGDQCVLHGKGWEKVGVRTRSFVPRKDEAEVYSGAAAALSISMHEDLARYTSDRLWRMLGCRSLCLVERFPDMEAFGLEEGITCFIWSGWDDMGGLKNLLSDLERGYFFPAMLRTMRDAALELAKLHTWEARALELLAIVDAIRAARKN